MNMKDFPIPQAALEQHTAVLGKTGSGKTSTSKLIVEHVVADGHRVCVLDPIKSDWWGLTSSADGKKPGLPFHILGGPRGHVPLHSSAGRAIGEIVASGALPLSILDMADFEPGGLQRFFVDFAPALLKKMRGVLYLVIEEAHEFAPKERSGIGAENLAIHWAKKLATAGRSKGIRLIVATQRTQSLHNALLGSCDTMIVHRLTAPADQEPVKKWLKANATKEVMEKVDASLASQKTGSAWICSGEAKVFEQVQFPRISTYDNSATPTKDSGVQQVKTAPVDQEKLRSIIGDAIREAAENDPKELKAEISRLKAQVSGFQKSGTQVKSAPDPKAIEEATANGFSHGKAVGWASGYVKGWDAALGAVNTALTELPRPEIPAEPELNTPIARAVKPRPVSATAPRPTPAIIHQANGEALTPSLQKVLDAIAWWKHIGVEPVRRERASVVAGYSPKASTFGVYIADLVKRGYIETAPGTVHLTEQGLALANIPTATSKEDLRALARDLLDPQPARVFDAIYDAYPQSIRRDDVAEAVGLSPKASTCGVYIAAVAAYGIIEADGRGSVRAADWLFP